MSDLDRFDRMLLELATRPVAASVPAPIAPLVTRPVYVEREPVITSTRAPKYVDHTACPMCGVDRIGIEYHGTLRSGAKVHQLAAHTAEMRRVQSGQPRCLGAGMRVVFEGGIWKGLQTP